MSTKEIRISDLTVEEFGFLIRGQILNVLKDFESLKMPDSTPVSSDNDVIFIKEAMELIGMEKGSIYNRNKRREIPVLCSGNPLTFSRKDLLTWMEHGKPSVAQMTAMGLLKKRKK